MGEKIPGKARHAAAGMAILGGGLEWGTVPMAGRDIACWAGGMWSPNSGGCERWEKRYQSRRGTPLRERRLWAVARGGALLPRKAGI